MGMFFLLGNKKPNPDIWDANNRKERAEKINAHTQTHRFTQNQRYVHRVVAIFIMTTITGVTGIISIYIYTALLLGLHMWEITIKIMGHLNCTQTPEIPPIIVRTPTLFDLGPHGPRLRGTLFTSGANPWHNLHIRSCSTYILSLSDFWVKYTIFNSTFI